MKLLVATHSEGKLIEFRSLLKDYYDEIVSLKDLGITDEVEENGDTFIANATLKAEYYSSITGMPVIADDSGLCVSALNDEPGIFSARYCGTHGDDKGNRAKLLKVMKDVADRRCKFVSAIVLIDDTRRKLVAVGETHGLLLEKSIGSNGFGYDSIFYSIDLNKSFGIASKEEKNLISHRSRALNNLLDLLQKK